jgi:O-antigen ligase
MIGIIILNKIKLNINNNLKNVLYLIFFISIILTFSRAGYLTLLIITILNLKKYIRKIFLVLFILLFIYIIFPKPKSSGVELYRISSISSRLSNYNDTLRVFINHPLFGVGFNNYCVYRTNYLNEDSTISHSCSGSDSSMFLILATTGIVGILVFINSIYKFRRILVKNEYDDTLKLIFLSVFISSLFNNSLFYNFILGLMAVFIGLTRKIKSNSDKLQKVP